MLPAAWCSEAGRRWVYLLQLSSSAARSPAEETVSTLHRSEQTDLYLFLYFSRLCNSKQWEEVETQGLTEPPGSNSFSFQAGEQTASALHQKTLRLVSQRWRAATASVHPAGQMNSGRLRSSTALRPAFVPPPNSPCLWVTACLTLPSTPPTTTTTTAATLSTASSGEASASRSKERSPR